MAGNEPKNNFESLEELEQIEGNYFKMDFFVAGSLALFTVWVFMAEKSFGWTLLLGGMAILFFIRGVRNWKGKTLPAQATRSESRPKDES
ncbi:MAG: hypothetical protein FVQ81_13550 [Candidatus Glassbacteria bacterium]|nr:hypothetical protein [Candidatus Glassbacteria bacterium]